MNVEAINNPGMTGQKTTAPEQVASQRKEREKVADSPQAAPKKKKVPTATLR